MAQRYLTTEPVNIISDSRSALQAIQDPNTCNEIAAEIQSRVEESAASGKYYNFFWIKAHAGIEGNERADQLAKKAALTSKQPPAYEGVPVSFVKYQLRQNTIQEWQKSYSGTPQGEITKHFFPDVRRAHRVLSKFVMTNIRSQIFTGHGGLGEYLHRFKLRQHKYCECDGSTSESLIHVICDCPKYLTKRSTLETRTGVPVTTNSLVKLVEDDNCRTHFLTFAEGVLTQTNLYNKKPTPAATVQIVPSNNTQQDEEPTRTTTNLLLQYGERGEPGIRIRGVALFMDRDVERVGISFCRTNTPNSVMISPGLAALTEGSTFNSTIRRSTYNALPETSFMNQRCRIMRFGNKMIALFEGKDEATQFAQANAVLKELGEAKSRESITPLVVSIDAMVVGHVKGKAEDYVGIVKASAQHEVVAYEDRGENLDFLKPQRPGTSATPIPTDSWGHPIANPDSSGSERLQQKRDQDVIRGKHMKHAKADAKAKESIMSMMLKTLNAASQRQPGSKNTGTLLKIEKTITTLTTCQKANENKEHQVARYKADRGLVEQPQLRPVSSLRDHLANAFLEFQALTKATKAINRITCETILQAFHRNEERLLNLKLEEASAAVYNNNTMQIVAGTETAYHMAAYSATHGFVPLDENETRLTGCEKFKAPPDDPIVVVARCTRIMLEDRIISRASSISETLDSCRAPKITWVNGVPGCGKSTWIVKNFAEDDVVVTTTTEAANDLRVRLAPRIGAKAKAKVRTMASILVNGSGERSSTCTRLLVDEALMNHFGAIVMAILITGASEALLIGDINQLPFIDRHNLFELHYLRPYRVTSISRELLCTHRSPMDVAYALKEVYSGIYSSTSRLRSLELKPYTGAQIPKTLENCLYLAYTQADKAALEFEGYGTGAGSRTLTIHEAQGLTCETVVIIRASAQRSKLHSSVSHAVVAVSRHKLSCTYYTDDYCDATAYFIKQAVSATTEKIKAYNIKMAIRDGNERVLAKQLEQKPP